MLLDRVSAMHRSAQAKPQAHVGIRFPLDPLAQHSNVRELAGVRLESRMVGLPIWEYPKSFALQSPMPIARQKAGKTEGASPI